MTETIDVIHGGITFSEIGLPWFRVRDYGECRYEAWRNLHNGDWDVWDVAVVPALRLPKEHPDHSRIVNICQEAAA